MSIIFTPLILPNGQSLPNRLCKAAMEENMAEAGQLPGTALVNLYNKWAKGAPGMILTGNVMVDPTAMTGPGGVVLEAGTLDEADVREKFEAWARAGKSGGSKLVMRVQIHAAHGYLLAQFLSPLTNLRDDKWGGPLENRARLLLEVIRAIRARVSDDFIVGVKLNSADFQKGGFDVADASQVTQWLNGEAVDFVEISGGSYESGVTKHTTAELALAQDGVDIVGIARAMAYHPNLPADWKAGKTLEAKVALPNLKNRVMAGLAAMAMTKANLYRIGDGKAPKAAPRPLLSLVSQQLRQKKQTKQYRNWLSSKGHEFSD